MIPLGCANHEELVRQAVDGLTHRSFPCCWNVVVPPGFGDVPLREALVTALRAHPSRPLVAVVSPKWIEGPEDYLDRLRRQWLDPAPQSDRPERAAMGDVALDGLLADVRKVAESGGEARPVVLVHPDFHRILDHLRDWVLGKLRTEEQAYRLRTINLSPVPYAELKRRWEIRKHVFSSSDYGDTHEPLLAQPWTPESVRELAGRQGVAENVADFLAWLTGGYPAALEAALGKWVRERHRHLDRRSRTALERWATGPLGRFVDWLDPVEDRRYRDHLIHFYLTGDQEAHDVLVGHPWKEILFRGDELRAEALGAAALAAATRDAREPRVVATAWGNALERARLMYERRQYATSVKLFQGNEVAARRPEVGLFGHNARIMSELYGDGDEVATEDIRWIHLRNELQQARKFLNRHGSAFDASDRTRLAARYAELDDVAEKVALAAAVKGSSQTRLVDILAGMVGSASSPRHAALLLWQKYEASRAIPSPSRACQDALALPEQTFCVWAFWKLGVTDAEVPAGHEDVWDRVEDDWRRNGRSDTEALRRPRPGDRFPSFTLFTSFVRFRAADLPFGNLEADLAFYVPIRNGKAHRLTTTLDQHRQRYFDLIHRWLGAMLSACPTPEPITEPMLQMMLAPLPVIPW